jgi:hypothetical protein
MRITTITTVGQHSKGLDIHLRNLRWALGDHKIVVQTFKSHQIKTDVPNVEIIEHEADTKKWYYFWDHTHEIIKRYAPETDWFLLMEQDIFFTSKPTDQIFAKEPIQLSLESGYLAIFDSQKKMVYPRIWEGATFIKSNLLIEAIEKGVSLGGHPRWHDDLAKNYYTTLNGIDYPKVQEYIDSFDSYDTLFAFSFFCFKNKISFRSTAASIAYEIGNHVVHLRGADMFLRDEPDLYSDFKKISHIRENDEAGRIFKRLSNGCSLLFLISGIQEPSFFMAKNLLNDCDNSFYWIKKKIEILSSSAHKWLTQEEQKRLDWAKQITNKPNGLIKYL